MRYLGKVVTVDGYTMDPADVVAVRALKKTSPRTVGTLRKLLGFISYYRQCIKDFSRLAKPLYVLLISATDPSRSAMKTGKQKESTKSRPTPLRGQFSSNQHIRWTEEHQERLNLLVDSVMQPGVMAYPDFKEPFVLHTDASADGLGAVLYQEQGGKLRVVGYGSRTLTPAERNFLALKWAITDKFRDYLNYAPSFLPLMHLRNSPKVLPHG